MGSLGPGVSLLCVRSYDMTYNVIPQGERLYFKLSVCGCLSKPFNWTSLMSQKSLLSTFPKKKAFGFSRKSLQSMATLRLNFTN